MSRIIYKIIKIFIITYKFCNISNITKFVEVMVFPDSELHHINKMKFGGIT